MRSSGLPSIFSVSFWYMRGVMACPAGFRVSRIAPRAVTRRVARAAGLDALHGQRADAERVAEAGRDFFELDNALGVGLFVNAVERRRRRALPACGDAFVGGQHEFLDQAVGPFALERVTPCIMSGSSNSMTGSGRSKSMEPRASRLRFSMLASSHAARNSRTDEELRAQACSPSRMAWTLRVGHARGGADDALVIS